jgi:hypothetical protein
VNHAGGEIVSDLQCLVFHLHQELIADLQAGVQNQSQATKRNIAELGTARFANASSSHTADRRWLDNGPPHGD